MKIKLIDFGVPERMFICPMTVPYSPEKSPKFLLVLDWKYRMDMRDISFPVPAWR